MTRVALYTRLSLDRTGEQTATARQEESCRKHAAARDWTIVEVFEETDVSAFQPNVVRARYEALLQGVRDKRFDGVLVWKLDRLVRRPAEFERFWLACEATRTFLASVTEPVDSSTEIGLAIVRVLVTFASLESATRGERIRAKARQLAEQGMPSLGGTRGFGHTADCSELVPEEAAILRESAKRILSGETTSSVCRDLAARGVVTARGGLWTPRRLMEVLKSARVGGHRSWHGGEIVAHDCFAPILDPVTHLRIRRLAASRATGKNNWYERTLASGLLYCGECGHVLHSRRNKNRTYSCPSPPIGCGHVHVVGDLVEAHLTEQVLTRLDLYPPRLPQRRRFQEASYRGVVEDLERLHRDYYVARTIDRDSYLRCRGELDEQLRIVSTRSSLPAVEGLPTGFDLRSVPRAWPVLTAQQRRAVIVSELYSATVNGARTRRWDPERIVIEWRREVPAA